MRIEKLTKEQIEYGDRIELLVMGIMAVIQFVIIGFIALRIYG